MYLSCFLWVVSILLAILIGKGISKLKLPMILGWLLAGMLLGPHGLNLLSSSLMATTGYNTLIHFLECTVGLMIGTELVWSDLKQSGKSILITTLTQSLGTFLLVSVVFSLVFYFTNIPVYLGFIFGGIALATAPAPALSIVNEFHTDGPVTKTLLPMAALDDMVGVVVFFTTITIITGQLSEENFPAYMIAVVVLLPLVIGAATGYPAALLLRRFTKRYETLLILFGFLALTTVIGYFCNQYLVPQPILNFMLMGMSFSAVFSNLVTKERLAEICKDFQPFLTLAMVIVILNLGAPLDYHLVLGAGLYTAIYIGVRAAGKYFGARIGATLTHAPVTVQKYLGLTLLPHSGVSLVFTGIAVSMLSKPAPQCAQIIQGTIAAAAVINEIIAVIVAKKGFQMAGEMGSQQTE